MRDDDDDDGKVVVLASPSLDGDSGLDLLGCAEDEYIRGFALARELFGW